MRRRDSNCIHNAELVAYFGAMAINCYLAIANQPLRISPGNLTLLRHVTIEATARAIDSKFKLLSHLCDLVNTFSSSEQQVIDDKKSPDNYRRIGEVKYRPEANVNEISDLSETHTVDQIAYSAPKVKPQP